MKNPVTNVATPHPYDAVYRRSIDDPEAFWREAAEALTWTRPFDRVLDTSKAPLYRWFPGGGFNICYNALDRHVASGRGKQTAIIYDSPVTESMLWISYADLLERVSHFAGALAKLGVTKGDRVVIYMPMVPEALVAMLACARIGAVHSVVFGGFASNELATRIDDAAPVVIVSASCGIEGKKILPYKPLLDAAIDMATAKPRHCIILQRPQAEASMVPGRDLTWDEALVGAEPAPCADTLATDPLYILYTSGTTGAPKGVVRDHGGYAVALHWSFANIFNMAPGEVMFTASDVGWVVGHSYIVYAPLLRGSVTVLYEGKAVGTPDAGAFWRVAEQHRVATMFTAPTAFRAIRREDGDGEYIAHRDLETLRALFLAGERCDPPTLLWAQEKLKIPVVDNWWQTETGWPIAGNSLGHGALPIKPGSAARPAPGWDVRVLDAEGVAPPVGEIGNLVIKLPMPPGSLATFWQADDRYIKSCLSQFDGYYATSDAGFIDEDGYVFVMTRTDDVINVAAHRLSTGGLEEAVAGHPAVAECAVVGVEDAIKGQVPLCLITLRAGTDRKTHAAIEQDIAQRIRDQIGAIAAPKRVLVVDRLPKTRSGKILRQSIRSLADGTPVRMPATIEDPAVLDEIGALLKAAGFGQA
jgi:propionyl-CoA synthetase